NLGAIGSDGTGFFIHLDGAVEGTVYRVATQQRRPFMNIIGRFGTHNNSAQTKFSAATSVVQQNASQQTANTPEPVQDHICGLAEAFATLINDACEFIAHKCFGVATYFMELLDHTSQVH